MRPEKLLVCSIQNDDPINGEGNTNITALFEDEGHPILFRACLPFEERSYESSVHSDDEGSADFFSHDDLLDACFCAGALKPEHEKWTDELRKLSNSLETESECNTL